MPILPSELLHAVAERKSRITLILGAGCSLEAPTNLKLAGWYAEDAARQLVLNGTLNEADCTNPSDLSTLATAVVAKTGGQSPLVRCLPRGAFRLAKPNDGYLLAAALLREGVLDSVLTLNFDLALTAALGVVGADGDVSIVPGPRSADQLGRGTVIYLHRSVEEEDLEKWILTTEALTNDWQEGWEEVVARRVMACPVVVFAGLGSPAAVLTETVTRVRQAVDERLHHILVVDPAATTEFEAALRLGPDAHVQTGWTDFMQAVAQRLLAELDATLLSAGRDQCAEHGWHTELEHLPQLCERMHGVGLLALGQLKAMWLLDPLGYAPDDSRRVLVADLLLGVGLIERGTGLAARFRADGVVELLSGATVTTSVLPISGLGTLRWAALEARVLQEVQRRAPYAQPEHVLVSGAVGGAAAPVLPQDLVAGDTGDDIIGGFRRPQLFSADELRAHPEVIAGLVA